MTSCARLANRPRQCNASPQPQAQAEDGGRALRDGHFDLIDSVLFNPPFQRVGGSGRSLRLLSCYGCSRYAGWKAECDDNDRAQPLVRLMRSRLGIMTHTLTVALLTVLVESGSAVENRTGILALTPLSERAV